MQVPQILFLSVLCNIFQSAVFQAEITVKNTLFYKHVVDIFVINPVTRDDFSFYLRLLIRKLRVLCAKLDAYILFCAFAIFAHLPDYKSRSYRSLSSLPRRWSAGVARSASFGSGGAASAFRNLLNSSTEK